VALTRRQWLKFAPVGAWALAGCGGTSPPIRSAQKPTELFRTGGGSHGTILVFLPETSQTKEVWTGLTDELKRDFELVAVRVDTAADVPIIAQAIEQYTPRGLVLMNNPTVSAYREYQRQTGGTRFPPATVVMTSFFDEVRQQTLNATGISYEVPLITVMTNLRKLSESPIDRVGVIRRAGLAGFVKRQADLAIREQIVVIEEEVSPSPNASEIKRALRLVKERVEAIWVLNDDHLLLPQLISDGWLPGLNERPRVPALVGAASLVSAATSFGTFAVLPDHIALGAQAANLIYEIEESGWVVRPERESLLPLSVTTILDMHQARERVHLRADAGNLVDRILE
jgi:hypothetical protein